MRIIFPTDEHHPYADAEALSVAMQIAEDYDPELRIAGSDGMDFYSLSKYDKDPSRMKGGGLQHEIDVWVSSQRAWRDATPSADVRYFVGNHEDRLRRWLWRHPEIHGLEALTLPNLLKFDELGIAYEREEEVILFDQLVVKHGSLVRDSSAYSARAEVEREHYRLNTLTGHTHRGGISYTTARGRVVMGVECFCLCDLNPKYVKNPDWQQGIVLADVTAESLSVEPVVFFRLQGRLRARWRGKEYLSR